MTTAIPTSGGANQTVNNLNKNPFFTALYPGLQSGAYQIQSVQVPVLGQFGQPLTTGGYNNMTGQNTSAPVMKSQLAIVDSSGKPVPSLSGVNVMAIPGASNAYQLQFSDPGSEGSISMAVGTGKNGTIAPVDINKQMFYTPGAPGGVLNGFVKAAIPELTALGTLAAAAYGAYGLTSGLSGLASSLGGVSTGTGATALGTAAGTESAAGTGLASLGSSVNSAASAFGTGGGSIASDAATAAGAAGTGAAGAAGTSGISAIKGALNTANSYLKPVMGANNVLQGVKNGNPLQVVSGIAGLGSNPVVGNIAGLSPSTMQGFQTAGQVAGIASNVASGTPQGYLNAAIGAGNLTGATSGANSLLTNAIGSNNANILNSGIGALSAGNTLAKTIAAGGGNANTMGSLMGAGNNFLQQANQLAKVV